MLPTSSTIQGIPLIIRDATGRADANNIWISTQRFDLIDHYASTIRLNSSYQSFKVVPYSTTRYAITVNYTTGLAPFGYSLTFDYVFTQRFLQRSWRGVASSASGTILAAIFTSNLYVSYDSGVNWSNPLNQSGAFNGIAMSSDGTYMVAAMQSNTLWVSTDSGNNWTSRDSSRTWWAVATSADGSIMLATTSSATAYAYVSTDYGTTWTQKTSAYTQLYGCAMSSNGTIMYLVAGASYVYVSTDTGNTWTQKLSVDNWNNVCCSADGTIAYAIATTSIYKTTDSGATWTLIYSPAGNFGGGACSSDGQTFVTYFSWPSTLQVSFDGGATFKAIGSSQYWAQISVNALASQIFASVTLNGYLYTGALSLT